MNKILYAILLFLVIIGSSINAQDADLLRYFSYEKDNIQCVNIYRLNTYKNKEISALDLASMLQIIEGNTKDDFFENNICLYGIISYDTLGRIISKKYDYDFFVARYRFMYIKKINYPDNNTQCSVEEKSWVFETIKPESLLPGDSTIYQYDENDGKLNLINSYYKNYQKSIKYKIIYKAVKNCSIIVVKYENDKMEYLYFYEFIYYDR